MILKTKLFLLAQTNDTKLRQKLERDLSILKLNQQMIIDAKIEE